jgi:hypothetical protein
LIVVIKLSPIFLSFRVIHQSVSGRLLSHEETLSLFTIWG